MPKRRRKAKLPRCIRLHTRGRYRAEITIDKKRIVGPLRSTVDEAVDDRDEMQAARTADVNLLWTLQDGLDQVYRDLEATGARPATVTYYRNHARILFEVFADDALLREVTENDILTYIELRLNAGVSLQTIWGKELQVLERIVNLALKRDVLTRSPFRNIRRPKLRAKRRDPMSVEHLAVVLERIRSHDKGRLGERDADIIAFAFLTGMRRAEIARLRPTDADFANGQLFVDGKNRERYLPIVGELETILRRMVARAEGDVLVGGERLIEKVFARWKDRLGDPLIVPRSMRHGMATHQAADGLNPFELQLLMGHARLEQTQRYYHGRSDQSRDAVRSVGDRLAGRTRRAEQSDPDAPAAGEATG